MLSSFMQVQTISSALRCTIRPGVSLSHMLLSCCRSHYSLCLLFCRAFPAGQGNPYKLSVVPRSQVKGQAHWSISATGICHIDSDHAAVFVPSGMHRLYRLMLLYVPEIPCIDIHCTDSVAQQSLQANGCGSCPCMSSCLPNGYVKPG